MILIDSCGTVYLVTLYPGIAHKHTHASNCHRLRCCVPVVVDGLQHGEDLHLPTRPDYSLHVRLQVTTAPLDLTTHIQGVDIQDKSGKEGACM